MFFTVLSVAAGVQRFTGLAVVLLPCPSSNVAVEVDVGGVELLFPRLQERVQLFHQSRDLLTIEMAAVVVQIVEVGGFVVLQFVIPAFDSPDVGPVRRGRMICTEKVE